MTPQGRCALEAAQWLPNGRRRRPCCRRSTRARIEIRSCWGFPNPGLATCQDFGLGCIRGFESEFGIFVMLMWDCVG